MEFGGLKVPYPKGGGGTENDGTAGSGPPDDPTEEMTLKEKITGPLLKHESAGQFVLQFSIGTPVRNVVLSGPQSFAVELKTNPGPSLHWMKQNEKEQEIQKSRVFLHHKYCIHWRDGPVQRPKPNVQGLNLKPSLFKAEM